MLLQDVESAELSYGSRGGHSCGKIIIEQCKESGIYNRVQGNTHVDKFHKDQWPSTTVETDLTKKKLERDMIQVGLRDR